MALPTLVTSDTDNKNKKAIESIVSLKIIAKNFMSLPGMARDLNVARQNIVKLVQLQGGTPTQKADAQFKKAGLIEQKLETERAKALEKIKPVPVKKVSKLGFMAKLGKFLQNILKFVLTIKTLITTGIIVPAVLITAMKDSLKQKIINFFVDLYQSAKEFIITKSKEIYETLSKKFNELAENLGEFFSEKFELIKEKFLETKEKVIIYAKELWSKLSNWFAEKFAIVAGYFQQGIDYIKNAWEALTAKIIDLKNKFIEIKESVKQAALRVKEKGGEIIEQAVTAVKEKGEKVLRVLSGRDAEEALLSQQELDAKRKQEEEKIKKKNEQKQKQVNNNKKNSYKNTIKTAKLKKRSELESLRKATQNRLNTETNDKNRARLQGQLDAYNEALSQLPEEEITKTPTTVPIKKEQVKKEKPIKATKLTDVMNKQQGVNLKGFKPEFEKRLIIMGAAFLRQTGKKLLVTSGYRSDEYQAKLFDEKVAQLKKENPKLSDKEIKAMARKKVALPVAYGGSGSRHRTGHAIDINSKGDGGISVLAGSQANPTGWLEKFGLTRPVNKENWHIQPIGDLPTPDNPIEPGEPIAVADAEGKAIDVSSGKKVIEDVTQPPKQDADQINQASRDIQVDKNNAVSEVVADNKKVILVDNSKSASVNNNVNKTEKSGKKSWWKNFWKTSA